MFVTGAYDVKKKISTRLGTNWVDLRRKMNVEILSTYVYIHKVKRKMSRGRLRKKL